MKDNDLYDEYGWAWDLGLDEEELAEFTEDELDIITHNEELLDAWQYMDRKVYDEIQDYNMCNDRIEDLFNNPHFTNNSKDLIDNLRAEIEYGRIEIPRNLLDSMIISLQDALSEVEDLEKECGY